MGRFAFLNFYTIVVYIICCCIDIDGSTTPETLAVVNGWVLFDEYVQENCHKFDKDHIHNLRDKGINVQCASPHEGECDENDDGPPNVNASMDIDSGAQATRDQCSYFNLLSAASNHTIAMRTVRVKRSRELKDACPVVFVPFVLDYALRGCDPTMDALVHYAYTACVNVVPKPKNMVETTNTFSKVRTST